MRVLKDERFKHEYKKRPSPSRQDIGSQAVKTEIARHVFSAAEAESGGESEGRMVYMQSFDLHSRKLRLETSLVFTG